MFSALKLQVGSLREQAPGELAPRLTRVLELIDVGTRSIRSVIDDLRPAALDDLGLIPAIRALASDFREWSGLTVVLELPDRALGPLTPARELALFRAVQEGLSNIARHAQAQGVRIGVATADGRLRLTIADDGVGVAPAELDRLTVGAGRSGLLGMRERLAAEGGSVALEPTAGGGLTLRIDLPVEVIAA